MRYSLQQRSGLSLSSSHAECSSSVSQAVPMTSPTTILRRSFVVFWLLLVGLSWGAAEGRADSLDISEKEEIETGKRIALEAEIRYGSVLAADDPLAVRVNRVGQSLARLSGRHHIPFTYQVLDNPHIANAFSIGGGPIFITKKLVTMTANDAELAYVLGHETGHIDRRHMVNDMEKQRRVAHFALSLGHAFGKGGSVLGGISYLTYALWSLGYSRNQETEADIVGVRLMSQLGYDPRTAINMLAKFDKLYPHSTGGYLSTHPAAAVREARIRQLIDEEKLMDAAEEHGGPRLWGAATPNGPMLNESVTIKAARHLNALIHSFKSLAAGAAVPVAQASVEN